ncbi:hypothetical protein [Clostridium sp. DMHC 10]|uniref:hypothetical protein n=1 Tax=Clostridium sp. DMHC 10 TaxID=747377 RepID=UPI000AE10CCF|nr:hypothetical protein [Clostridium sp. DMHC 10]
MRRLNPKVDFAFKKLLSNYPASIRVMLGINIDYITSILGFYSMIFSFIVLSLFKL